MIITEEILTKVRSLGMLHYPLWKCLNILEINSDKDRDFFEQEFKNAESKVAKEYQIGIDLADFEIDTKLLHLAKTGDLRAIAIFDERKKSHPKKKKNAG